MIYSLLRVNKGAHVRPPPSRQRHIPYANKLNFVLQQLSDAILHIGDIHRHSLKAYAKRVNRNTLNCFLELCGPSGCVVCVCAHSNDAVHTRLSKQAKG